MDFLVWASSSYAPAFIREIIDAPSAGIGRWFHKITVGG
jgi:hypothetical protein